MNEKLRSIHRYKCIVHIHIKNVVFVCTVILTFDHLLTFTSIIPVQSSYLYLYLFRTHYLYISNISIQVALINKLVLHLFNLLYVQSCSTDT